MSPDNVVSTSSVATPCVHEIAGAGVEGDINGEHVIVGSQSLFENNDNSNYHRQQQQQQQQQQSELEFDKELLLNTIKKRAKGKRKQNFYAWNIVYGIPNRKFLGDE